LYARINVKRAIANHLVLSVDKTEKLATFDVVSIIVFINLAKPSGKEMLLNNVSN